MATVEKIVPAPGITVWTDKQGVTREYREVKRKATVGELVKTDRACGEFYASGSVGRVTSQGCGVGVEVDFNGFGNEVKPDGEWYVGSDIGYVVLEPTDIVHHDGKRYREVKRLAAAGELVRVTDNHHGHGFAIGQVVRCIAQNTNSDGPFYSLTDSGDKSWMRADGDAYDEYVVLDPVIDHQQPDRLTALEKRVAALELRLTTKHEYDELWEETKQNFVNAWSQPSYTREQVIELAKKDVEELLKTSISPIHGQVPNIFGGRTSFYPKGCSQGYAPCDDVDFKVDRKKRTVVALVRELNGKVWAKGIAKSAPDDCFNVHIGRAIALRRALGLDVPDYYVNAPKPTKAQVGDVVTFPSVKSTTMYHVRTLEPTPGNLRIVKSSFDSLVGGGAYVDSYSRVIILDDSHDFGGEFIG